MSEFDKDLTKLLGKVIDSPEVREFQQSLDPKAKVKREDGEKMWWSKAAGIEIHSEETEDRITAVYLYAEGTDGYRQFKGVLPERLSFDLSRQQVRDLMKVKPGFSDDGKEPYDTWDRDDYRVVVSYDAKGKITSVYVSGDF